MKRIGAIKSTESTEMFLWHTLIFLQNSVQGCESKAMQRNKLPIRRTKLSDVCVCVLYYFKLDAKTENVPN